MVEADPTVALDAARAGAAVVAAAASGPLEVRFKAEADPVTVADHRSEQAILGVISSYCPGDRIVCEERGGDLPGGGRVWLVDPLDGTTNLTRGFPWTAVSVALWIDNIPAAAAVVDVTRGDEYTAEAGGGAHLNGRPISVSSAVEIADALVVTGFPYERARRVEVCDSRFRRVLGTALGVRRLGAASLDMCMVACGRMDAYWEEDLAPWDMGAGALIVTEAGGTVTGPTGEPVTPAGGFVAASNGRLHRQFLDTLAEPGPPRPLA